MKKKKLIGMISALEVKLILSNREIDAKNAEIKRLYDHQNVMHDELRERTKTYNNIIKENKQEIERLNKLIEAHD